MPVETREEMLARFPDNAIGAIDADDTRALVNAVYDIGEEPSTAITYEGDHVPATTYEDGDIVVVNGVAYMCVGGPTTAAPDPAPWDAVGIPLPPPSPSYGTTLPAAPVDGQEAILVDSLTVPTYIWRFRYNAQATGGYKWEFVGGAPAYARIDTSETTTSTSNADLATVGPQITLPRDGEYMITYQRSIRIRLTSHNVAWVNVSGSVAQPEQQAIAVKAWGGANYDIAGQTARLIVTGSRIVKMQYSVNGGTRRPFLRRILQITPVRVA